MSGLPGGSALEREDPEDPASDEAVSRRATRRVPADMMGDLFAALDADARRHSQLANSSGSKPAAHPMATHVGFDRHGRFVHYCSCGRWAAYGELVAVKEGKLGVWHCAACKS